MPWPTVDSLQQNQVPVASGSVAIDLSTDDVVFSGTFPVAIRVDGAGTVKFTALDGTVDTWTCGDFDTIDVAVQRVWKTGTEATGLHAMFVGNHG